MEKKLKRNNNFNTRDFYLWFDSRKTQIASDIIDLINIDTQSPFEERCFPWVKKYLKNLNFKVKFEKFHQKIKSHPSFSPHLLSKILNNRGNLRAVSKKVDNYKKTVLFNCHIDVVPPANDFANAFDGYIERNKIFGRGACDTKNNLIMLGEALRFLKDNNIKLTKNPLIDLVIEEEIGGNGTLSTVMHGIAADEVICLEPTSLNVFRGHRGCISFDVDVKGMSVHMGNDKDGINAIEWTIEVIKILKELEKELLHEAKGSAGFKCWKRPLQLNIGIISGGEWSGTVPERCRLSCDLGFLPKYSIEQIEKIIEKKCRSVKNSWISKNIKVSFNGLRNDAYIINKNIDLVRDMIKCCVNNGINQSGVYGWNVSCDARYYAKDANLPVIIFGSGNLINAHSAHEYIDLDELKKGACILAEYLSN